MESASLGKRDPEKNTKNSGRSLLGRITINWMMKCDFQDEITYKFNKNEYTVCSEMLTSSYSVDPTSGFEHL